MSYVRTRNGGVADLATVTIAGMAEAMNASPDLRILTGVEGWLVRVHMAAGVACPAYVYAVGRGQIQDGDLICPAAFYVKWGCVPAAMDVREALVQVPQTPQVRCVSTDDGEERAAEVESELGDLLHDLFM